MKILRTGARECFTDLPLHVNWLLTNNCNYRCSYCFIYGKGKKPPIPNPFPTLEQLKIAVNNIASLNRPWYDIVFSGGEPTILPQFFDLISMLYETLRERLNKIIIITNGSRNESLYGKITEIAKSVTVNLSISIHTDHVDMEHILEIIEKLSSDVNMDFSLMFNPDKREFVHQIYETMLEQRKKHRFYMNVLLIRDGDRVDPRYTPEDFTWQKEANEQFKELTKAVKLPVSKERKLSRSMNFFSDIEDGNETKTVENVNYLLKYSNGMIQFGGMYCIAKASLLFIMSSGLCKGMVCDDDHITYKIYQENCFSDVREKIIYPVKCTKRLCGCSANYCIPKFASEEEAKKFVEFAQKRQAQLFDEYLFAQKKQYTPPVKQEDKMNSYEVYVDSICNPFADASPISFRNSFANHDVK